MTSTGTPIAVVSNRCAGICAGDALDHAHNRGQLRVPDRRAAETQRCLLTAQGQLIIAVGGGDTVESKFPRQPGLRPQLRVAEGAQAPAAGSCGDRPSGSTSTSGGTGAVSRSTATSGGSCSRSNGSRQRPVVALRLDADGGTGYAAGQHMGAGHDQTAGRHEKTRAWPLRGRPPAPPRRQVVPRQARSYRPPSAGYPSAGRFQTIFTW